MSRSPLKDTLTEAEFQEIINYQEPSRFQQISNDPNAQDIFGMDPNTFQYYQQYGELPPGPDSPYYGRPGEGGGAAPVSTMVNMGDVPFQSQPEPTSRKREAPLDTIPRLGFPDMTPKTGPDLTPRDMPATATDGLAYRRDFSKSAFGNMTPTMQAGLIGGIGGIAQGLIGRAKRRREQRAAAAEYRARRADYESLDTSNLAADIQNPFAENVFEDLTVNQQAARFQEQQSAAARQNIMESLSGAAGGSGIASLAQSLANQATTAAQQASASIAQQEQRNEVLAAKGELQVQKGDAMVQQMQLAGAERSRMLERQQTETLFGMAQQRRAAADQAIAQANSALMGGIGSIAGTVLTGVVSNLASGLTFFGGGDMVKKT